MNLGGRRGGDGGNLPITEKEFREARKRARYGGCSVMTCGRVLDDDPWVMHFGGDRYAVCSPECAELALLMLGQPRGLVPDPDDLAAFRAAMSQDPGDWPENWKLEWQFAERPRSRGTVFLAGTVTVRGPDAPGRAPGLRHASHCALTCGNISVSHISDHREILISLSHSRRHTPDHTWSPGSRS